MQTQEREGSYNLTISLSLHVKNLHIIEEGNVTITTLEGTF